MAGCRPTAAILAFLLTAFTVSSLNLNNSDAKADAQSNSNLHIQFVPSQVEFQQVSQQYPETLARRLFSSVPRREFALHNVSFILQSKFVLLTGASSSGKSALVKMISGVETPVQGAVRIQCLWDAAAAAAAAASDDDDDPTPPHQSQQQQQQWVSQPVYLDQRPSIDGRRTVRQILRQKEEHILQKLLLSSSMTNNKARQPLESSIRIFLGTLLSALTAELCSCLQLTSTSKSTTSNDNTQHNGAAATAAAGVCWMDQTPLQLSPSQSYRLALVTACLQSSMANLNLSTVFVDGDGNADVDVDIDTFFPTTVVVDDDTATTDGTERRTIRLPAPILLLDEWMDTETTEIVQTVQRGLEQLARTGAVIVSVTHKAGRWKKPYSEMVLSRGQVLSWKTRIE